MDKPNSEKLALVGLNRALTKGTEVTARGRTKQAGRQAGALPPSLAQRCTLLSTGSARGVVASSLLLALLTLPACVLPGEDTGGASGELIIELFAEADTGLHHVASETCLNLGGDVALFVNENAMLVRMNDGELATALPAGEELASATLLLTSRNDCFDGQHLFAVYRMTQDWVEGSRRHDGTLARPSETTGATGLCGEDSDVTDELCACVPGTDWDVFGASPPHAPVATASALCRTGFRIFAFDVTADVVSFRSGLYPNHGWLVEGPHLDSASRATISTREVCGGSPCPDAPRLILVTRAAVPVPPEPTAPPLDRSVVTSALDAHRFLFEGPSPVQVGLSADALDPVRAAVVRGRVRSRETGLPLPGVQVRVLHEGHLGATATRASGVFDMVVEGGADLVLAYEHPDYLPAQRVVHVPPNDYVWAPDVALVREIDPLTQCSSAPGVAAGSGTVYTSAGGARPFHVYVPDGGVEVGGSAVPYRLCALEHTVDRPDPDPLLEVRGEEAMPAQLPAASGYTMAVEIEARDPGGSELAGARLASPGAVWVENTMGFPVGEAVPAGAYDYGQGAWTSEADGRVLRVDAGCTIVGLGAGESIPAPERIELCARLSVGTEFWRIPIEHFSTRDWNWPLRFIEGDLVPFLEWAFEDSPDEPCSTFNSTIGCEDQTLGEDVPIAGTTHSLHYGSERQSGRRDRYDLEIRIPAAPALPAGSSVVFTGVRLEVQVAGRRFTYPGPDGPAPAPDSSFTFRWDGLDAWGRRTQGAQPITVRLGFAFTTSYASPAPGGRSFALPGDADLTVDVASREVVFWRTRRALIGGWDARGEELGGFTHSAHHVYDTRAHVVHRGDGTRFSSSGLAEVIEPLAMLDGALSLATAPDGTLYVGQSSSRDGTRIWRVGRGGDVTPFAGTGVTTPVGAPVPGVVAASAATFRAPVAMAVRRDGSLLVAEHDHHCVRQVRDGLVTRFAGACLPARVGESCSPTGQPLGDGGLATAAGLLCPRGLAVAPDGAVYVAESTASAFGTAQRIRRVDPGGLIDTLAILRLAAADGSMAVDRDGALLVLARRGLAGLYLRRITARDADEVVLGRTGCAPGEVGDGLPGTLACLSVPRAVAVGPDGSIFVADEGQGRVRRLAPSGIVTTVAGGGTSDAETGPARSARLSFLRDVAVLPDGRVVVAQDRGVRLVRPALPDVFVGQVVVPEPGGSLAYVFDERGRHLRTRGVTGATLLEFGYGSAAPMGALETITEHAGGARLVTRIERAASGAPRAIVAPFGERTELLLDRDGYLSTVTVPGGTPLAPRAWGFDLDADGLLLGRTDPLGSAWVSSYDPAGSGRLASESAPLGTRVVTLERLDCGRPGFACSPGQLGWRTVLTEGPAGPRARILEFLSESWGGITRRQLDALGSERRSVQGVAPGAPVLAAPLAHAGSPTESVTVSRTARASDGTSVEVATGTDPRPGLGEYVRAARICRGGGCDDPAVAVRTTLTSLRTSRPPGATFPDEITETLTLNGARTITTRLDRTAGLGCAFGEVTLTQRSTLGRVTRACLDSSGRVTRVKAPGLAEVVLGYDAATGGLSSVSHAGRSARLSYVDESGATRAFVQSLALTVSGFPDPFEELTTVLDRDGAGWLTGSRLFDAAGTPAGALGAERDARGDVVALTLPQALDAAGRAAGEVHGLGWTALGAGRRYEPPLVAGDAAASGTLDAREGSFDALHRPTVITVQGAAGGTFGTVTLGYDPSHGQLASVSSSSTRTTLSDGTVVFVGARSVGIATDTASLDTDGLPQVTGHLTSVSGPDGADVTLAYDGPFLATETWSGTVSGAVSGAVDEFGELTSVRAAGVTRHYARDLDGELTCAGARSEVASCPDGLALTTVLSDEGTASEHWERSGTAGVAASDEVFDRQGELAQLSFEVAGSTVYSSEVRRRDLLGRVLEEAEVLGDGGPQRVRRYSYDALGRLVSVRQLVLRGRPGGPETLIPVEVASFGYDGNGNRLSASYDARAFPTMRRLGAEPASTAYDEQDRLSGYGGCRFEHDAAGNRVLQSCSGALGSVMGDQVLSWDLLGNLLSVNDVRGRVQVRYEADGFGRRVRRQLLRGGAPVASEERRWLYLDGLRPVAELDGAGALRWLFVWGTRPNVPELLVRGSDARVFRVVADVRGSVRRVIDTVTGVEVQRLEYDPFGYIVEARSSPGFEQPFRFAGGLWDPATEFLHFGAREYDPVSGRWLQKDPSLFAGGDPNLYAYVGNDPVNFIDPTGLFAPIVVAGGIVGGGAVAISQYGAYRSGRISGWDYAGMIAFGTLTGGLAGVPTTIFGSAFAGAAGAGGNDFFGQWLANADDPCASIDWGQTAGSAGLGFFAGAASGFGIEAGGNIVRLRGVAGARLAGTYVSQGARPGFTSFAQGGGIIGNFAGTAFGAKFADWVMGQ